MSHLGQSNSSCVLTGNSMLQGCFDYSAVLNIARIVSSQCFLTFDCVSTVGSCYNCSFEGNRECHPSGHYWDFYLGTMSVRCNSFEDGAPILIHFEIRLLSVSHSVGSAIMK